MSRWGVHPRDSVYAMANLRSTVLPNSTPPHQGAATAKQPDLQCPHTTYILAQTTSATLAGIHGRPIP